MFHFTFHQDLIDIHISWQIPNEILKNVVISYQVLLNEVYRSLINFSRNNPALFSKYLASEDNDLR